MTGVDSAPAASGWIGASTATTASAAQSPQAASAAAGAASSPEPVITPKWVLPEGCSPAQPSGAFTIALCQPHPESFSSKLLSGLPATTLSLLALAISIWGLSYNKRKDQVARRQSIEDDYWLRKVVSPLSIEPFLKHIHDLVAALPGEHGSTSQSVSDFWTLQTSKFNAFHIAFRTLALIAPELDETVRFKLEEIEDELASYCGLLSQHLDAGKGAPPDMGSASQRLMGLTIAMLRIVKTHQGTVGVGE